MRHFLLGSIVAGLSVVAIAACVGDDPGLAGTASSSSSSSTSSAGGGSSTSSSGASSSTGGPACAATETLCGTTCADVKTVALHCGRCDHGCGAGACVAGACQPFMAAGPFTNVDSIAPTPSGVAILADAKLVLCDRPEGCSPTALKPILEGVTGIEQVVAVGSDLFFFTNYSDNASVYRCEAAGCAIGVAPVEAMFNRDVGAIAAGPDTVAWTRRNSTFGPFTNGCGRANCEGSLKTLRPQSGVTYATLPLRETEIPSKALSVGAKSFLWRTGGLNSAGEGRQLRACPIAGPCTTPNEIATTGVLPGSIEQLVALAYHDGFHYGVTTGGDPGSGFRSILFRVSDADPTLPREVLASDADGAVDLAVDASGAYWLNATTRTIRRCAKPTGCKAAELETLAIIDGADAQAPAPRAIGLDGTFVFWTTPTAVFKVAK